MKICHILFCNDKCKNCPKKGILYGGRRLNHYNEDNFFIEVLIVNKLFLNYKLQVINEKIFELAFSLSFHVFGYPCCLKAWYESKSKVVFIILLLSPTTVKKICFINFWVKLTNLWGDNIFHIRFCTHLTFTFSVKKSA